MPQHAPPHLAREWHELLHAASPAVVARIGALAQQESALLATHFYASMLEDAVAAQFLSHERVQQHLHPAMQRWIASLFSMLDEDALRQQVAVQRRIGDIHARIDIPVALVLRGARALKARFSQRLSEIESDELIRAQGMRFFAGVIDFAMELMSGAYASAHERNARSDEAFRLFSVAQSAGTERERQRAALLDWENQLMFELAANQDLRLERLADSGFGLWFRHKGIHAFQGSSDVEQLQLVMSHIDEHLLPAVTAANSSTQRIHVLRDIREHARAVRFHLDALFEHASELEGGRDALTRLLNRKFLPVVLNKEIIYARRHKRSFAVLAIDIDHFKRINDTFGHEAGDHVLQQLAMLMNNSSRGGDFLFRLGGEEFLLLLVDSDEDAAFRVAEILRGRIANETFILPDQGSTKLTISIGLAVHDGHPDQAHLLRRADAALYRAKQGGRDRICVASSDQPGEAASA